ncbi:FAD/NAD-P-binding domain-containing protein [Mycena metata]|uniref:FAD/NAD-P-binding domain-containing protein n=1 Tax=Mycena metata TaxID=1033252 RepID=A0AAD7MLF9_9AGAR|nr:FAD/NAD-P-binding domain-containing protein [Mycena metata]
MALHQVFLVFLAFGLAVFAQSQFQHVFEKPNKQTGTIFHHPIQRVAVVGAGPAGLQAAAKLIEHNFTVRLFERAPHPGGNWLYSENTPVRESYPDEPTGTTDQIPAQLPTSRTGGRNIGDLAQSGTISSPTLRKRALSFRMFHTIPKRPGYFPTHTIQRHVRSYATHHCLNSNDYCPKTPGAPRVTSYSTRVEKVEKDEETHTWVLTLRRLEQLPESNRLREEWWTETFDAVVLASGPYTFAHVPDIEGIVDWSKAREGEQYSIYHSQAYRHPERYAGKTVLIVGASVSASEIARDLGPFVHRIIASVRYPRPPRLRSLSRFPNITEFVPEIASFEPLKSHAEGIRSGRIHLMNGSILQGVDEIILATGYRSHSLYPPNTTTRRPENISWTGHYVPDPTLAFTIGRPWTVGRYQSYGLAKVWEGSAPLPPPEQPPTEPNPGTGMWFPEAMFRQYITWLNDASLEHGGRFVEPLPIENVELLKYYAVVHFLNNTMSLDNIGLNSVSMFGKLEVEDPWDALADEGLDW